MKTYIAIDIFKDNPGDLIFVEGEPYWHIARGGVVVVEKEDKVQRERIESLSTKEDRIAFLREYHEKSPVNVKEERGNEDIGQVGSCYGKGKNGRIRS